MDYSLQNGTAREAMGAGFIVFGACAFFGLRFLIRGLRNDICDATGNPLAGRSWFIVGGIIMILPLIAFTIFAWKQGYART